MSGAMVTTNLQESNCEHHPVGPWPADGHLNLHGARSGDCQVRLATMSPTQPDYLEPREHDVRRRTLAIALIAALTVSAGSGWVAARTIASPAEVAARTLPPEPSPILVPVEERVLSADIVTRGSARFGSPQQLRLAPTALKAGPSVVDTLPLPGGELAEGDVVLTSSGRPVFLLVGDQPTFRDLGPGLQGTDVLQLEAALARLRFEPGVVDGRYDSDTEAAVRAWYEAADATPMVATEAQLAGIRTLEAELANARLEILTAEATAVSAERDLAMAGATLDAGRLAVTAAAAALGSTQAEAAAANAAAAAEVTDAPGGARRSPGGDRVAGAFVGDSQGRG